MIGLSEFNMAYGLLLASTAPLGSRIDSSSGMAWTSELRYALTGPRAKDPDLTHRVYILVDDCLTLLTSMARHGAYIACDTPSGTLYLPPETIVAEVHMYRTAPQNELGDMVWASSPTTAPDSSG